MKRTITHIETQEDNREWVMIAVIGFFAFLIWQLFGFLSLLTAFLSEMWPLVLLIFVIVFMAPLTKRNTKTQTVFIDRTRKTPAKRKTLRIETPKTRITLQNEIAERNKTFRNELDGSRYDVRNTRNGNQNTL